MSRNQFLCTRPRLAAILKGRGFDAELVANPWLDGRQAWLFAITPELKAEAVKFYEDIGKPLPAALQERSAP